VAAVAPDSCCSRHHIYECCPGRRPTLELGGAVPSEGKRKHWRREDRGRVFMVALSCYKHQPTGRQGLPRWGYYKY